MSKQNKQLSIFRLTILLILIVSLPFFAYKYFNNWKASNNIQQNPTTSWFGPYVDVTSTPRFAFEQMTGDSSHNVILSFIVASPENGCEPTWGGHYTLEEARGSLDLDRRIARLRQQSGSVAVSFGGLLNNELAVSCKMEDDLLKAYQEVINRYEIDTIDLDIEGNALRDSDSIERRANIIAKLQKEFKDKDKDLAVWLTLPVVPSGLTQDGTNAVSEMLKAGVDLAGVNVMTMDYGDSRGASLSMNEASQEALVETHRQLGILYKRVGIFLNEAALWTKIGATPMIGQNDVLAEIFTLEDADKFNQFVLSKNIARVSIWSANRDRSCGDNYVNISVVSDSCSGVKQEAGQFANILGNGFEGDITSNSSFITTPSPEEIQAPDDPKTSPYQIWAENGVYLEGTRVVWKHNVYQAKWWTKGDLPDNPVLQSYETPWQLIGPVLPGETPIPQATLPAGTFPTWSGEVVYDTGVRVLFDNIPYEAKWWTQGDSPAASTSNPDSSPWVVLTREEIEKILSRNQ